MRLATFHSIMSMNEYDSSLHMLIIQYGAPHLLTKHCQNRKASLLSKLLFRHQGWVHAAFKGTHTVECQMQHLEKTCDSPLCCEDHQTNSTESRECCHWRSHIFSTMIFCANTFELYRSLACSKWPHPCQSAGRLPSLQRQNNQCQAGPTTSTTSTTSTSTTESFCLSSKDYIWFDLTVFDFLSYFQGQTQQSVLTKKTVNVHLPCEVMHGQSYWKTWSMQLRVLY